MKSTPETRYRMAARLAFMIFAPPQTFFEGLTLS
jgi:hypothetical protein